MLIYQTKTIISIRIQPRYIPSQSFFLHGLVSTFIPRQSSPPCPGSGLSQRRSRVVSPWPQEREHRDHGDHVLQPPARETVTQYYRTIMT